MKIHKERNDTNTKNKFTYTSTQGQIVIFLHLLLFLNKTYYYQNSPNFQPTTQPSKVDHDRDQDDEDTLL